MGNAYSMIRFSIGYDILGYHIQQDMLCLYLFYEINKK